MIVLFVALLASSAHAQMREGGALEERSVGEPPPVGYVCEYPAFPTYDATLAGRALLRASRQLTECYARLVAPRPRARMVVRLAISPSGRAHRVRIEEDTSESPSLGTCIADVVARIQFPTYAGPADEADLAFPLTFVP